ncbi:type 1 fimbrial protein [Stenotrophomonas maltophilia]|nr:type 1 fimbrial protein [Stenotrophomonas maltophilia]
MNKNICIAALICCMVSPVAMAAPAEVKFSGTIKTTTCTIASTGADLDVKLGDVFAENLVDDTPSEITPFPAGIELNCAGGEKVAIAFQSLAHDDVATGLLKTSSGTASGFMLGIYSAGGVLQKINGTPTADSYVTAPTGPGTVKLDYKVAVVKTGGETIVNGDFNAAATILVDQQ